MDVPNWSNDINIWLHVHSWVHMIGQMKGKLQQQVIKHILKYTGDEFEYDALLSYDEEMDAFVLNELVKELQERRKIKIYIEFRDMLMGAYTNEELANITNKR